ncbi:MAG: hypothetical protein ACRDOD_09630, partial [Streptosporangiaceae bacterium]
MLSSERGYSRAAAAAKERSDHFGGVCTNATSKVCGSEPCGEGYLKASPYVCYVRVLRPDRGCEALEHQSAYLVGERQLTLQDLAVEAAQFQHDGDRRAGQCQLQSWDLCGEQILSDLDVLTCPACVSRDENIDERLGTRRALFVVYLDRDIGQPSREAIACHLRVVEVFQAAYDMMIPGDDRRNAEVYVTSLPVQLVPALPPRREH